MVFAFLTKGEETKEVECWRRDAVFIYEFLMFAAIDLDIEIDCFRHLQKKLSQPPATTSSSREVTTGDRDRHPESLPIAAMSELIALV